MKSRFTPSARAQFLGALQFIRQNDPEAAREFRETAEASLKRLERFPQSGRSIPEFPDLPHRELIVRPYRFFYRVADKMIWGIAVWHVAQLRETSAELSLRVGVCPA